MLNNNQPPKMVKNIIRSYARLCENEKAKSILKNNLPTLFYDKQFLSGLDEGSKKCVQAILKSLSFNQEGFKEIKKEKENFINETIGN